MTQHDSNQSINKKDITEQKIGEVKVVSSIDFSVDFIQSSLSSIINDTTNTKIFFSTNDPVYDSSGKINGLFGISRDITDFKKVEIELKKANRTLKMISECNQLMVKVQTEQELIDKVCDIIIEHGGYSMSWVGYIDSKNKTKNIFPVAQSGFDDGYLASIEVTCDENDKHGKGPIGIAIRNGRPIVACNIQTDPNFVPWREAAIKRGYNSSIALPLRGNNNIVIGVLSVYSNDSGAFNDEEFKLLNELSIDLSRGIQCFRSREEKIKLDKLLKNREKQLEIKQRIYSVGTLAGGVAHDLNNSLAINMGNLELALMDKELPRKVIESLNNALMAGRQAADTIRQLQNLSKNSVTEKNSIDIFQVANIVFEPLKKIIDGSIQVLIEFNKEECFINGNLSELHQIFLNLVNNSLKAIEEAENKEQKFIKIRANNYKSIYNDESGIPEGYYIHITFEDNGRGMSDNTLRNAFDPLFTTKQKCTKKSQGLGLTTVYNFVTESHKGCIFIESKEGQGTLVHLYLPKAIEIEKEKVEKKVETNTQNTTILIIDDEELIQNFLKNALELLGYKIIIGKNGKDGLDKYINNDDIDLVILDLTMPDISGQTVLEKMLEIKNDVKVIVASGQSDEVLRDGILSKAKGFLHKPYSVDELYEKVKNILGGRKQ
ncbi:MAG: GAF domain-containing protein [Candidatus Gracilibacteria bacterium]